ncbi:MAG: hypothetical protein NZV14_06080 [Bryobacteraceae bacterium]|nr:hypothetical protein [Bryobacteraceae bacterium]MDW8377709.1 hypothetical protein [Bryobacterales bacterium]
MRIQAWLAVVGIAGVAIHPHESRAQATSAKRAEPSIQSIYPFTLERGKRSLITVRGSGLKGVYAAMLPTSGLRARTRGVSTQPPGIKKPVDEVQLQIEVEASLAPGRYPLRLVTTSGVTNALPLLVTDLPVLSEPEGAHDAADTAIPIAEKSAVYAGRLLRRGEADYYRLEARAGEVMTFEVVSGLPQIAAAGSAATVPNFDPALTILEAGASWFDPRRLRRVAFNDEPAFVFGRLTDAHLTHRFERTGVYWLRVEAFAGQGGPDYSYHLKVLAGEHPPEPSPAPTDWQERSFSRSLTPARLTLLAARGGLPDPGLVMERYQAASTGAPQSPRIPLPAMVQGVIEKPGQTHRARFQLESPRDIAIEVETPFRAPPFFNPLVRLVNATGEEIATNLLVGKGACTGALTKSLQAKLIVPLREPGEYTLEVRELTADHAGSNFQYRIQLRPQIPHVGQVRIDADHFNLAPQEAKTIRVSFDREENYREGVAISVENLPPGVSAHTGSDFIEEPDPPEPVGKRERFLPKTEQATVVLSAAQDARLTPEPVRLRLLVRPLTNGRLGPVIAEKEIPLMVVEP